MARTKQSARHCTGDVAPRAKLGPKAKSSAAPATIDAVHSQRATSATSGNGKKRNFSSTDDPSDDANESLPASAAKLKKRSKVSHDDDDDYVPTGSRKNIPATGAPARRTQPTRSKSNAPPHTSADDVNDNDDQGEPAAHVDAPSTEPEPAPAPSTADWNMQRTVLPLLAQPLIATELENVYCHLCLNGGKTLACDECNRVICLEHVPDIAAVGVEVLNNLHFRCPSCHSRATRNLAGHKPRPYYGLYKRGIDGTACEPYLPHWASLDVEAARPLHFQVNTCPIVILSIRLASLDEDSSPARSLYNYLSPWFKGPVNGSLRYVDIPFNIRDTDDADKYYAQWHEILTAFGPFTHTRILTFIHTHSHDVDGDLFYTPRDCSSSLHDWWPNVIPPELKQLAMTPSNDLTIAVLACGAVVNNERPRGELLAAARDIGAKHMFCFGAKRFQAVLTTSFFINFAQRVLLEGMVIKGDCITSLFNHSHFLARHTPIWYFTRDSVADNFVVEVYDWTHDTMRPHGEDIGLQCPGCGSLCSRAGTFSKDHTITVKCSFTGCKWSRTFKPPAGVKKITLGCDNGRWRRRGITIKALNAAVVE